MSSLIPLEPVQNAVSFRDRVSIKLNRSGTELLNPIAGSDRNGNGGVGGHGVQLKGHLQDAAETVDSATARIVDDDGVSISTYNFKSELSLDISNLLFSANLIAGVHLPVGRNEVTISFNTGRIIKQRIYVAENLHAVAINGETTTETVPVTIFMEAIDGNIEVSWGVSFYPSWNDEIGRQHGANVEALGGAIVKPYGGAKTVEIYRVGAVHLSERNCETLNRMSWTPTGSGEIQTFECRFRSLTGSANWVWAQFKVKFVACPEEGAPVTTVTETYDNNPKINLPTTPPDTPRIPPEDGYVHPGPGDEVRVHVADIGHRLGELTDAATGRIRLRGYKGGISDDGSTMLSGVYTGEQIVAIATVDVGTDVTITLASGDIGSPTMVVAEIQVDDGAGGWISGNSIIHYLDESDVGSLPDAPTVSSVSFSYGTDTLSYTLDDYGWINEDVTLHIKPLSSVIANKSGLVQVVADMGIETGGAETTSTVLYSSGTGAKTFAYNTTNNEAICVWFTNSYGASSTISFFDKSVSNGNVIKQGPTISAASLQGALTPRSRVDFTLDADGGHLSNLTPVLIIVDSAQDQVQVTMSAITTGSGSRSFNLNTGHVDIDGHYYLGLVGAQGGMASNMLHIDNTVLGTNTLLA